MTTFNMGSMFSFDQLSTNLIANIAVFNDTLAVVKPMGRQLKSDRETLEDLKTVRCLFLAC